MVLAEIILYVKYEKPDVCISAELILKHTIKIVFLILGGGVLLTVRLHLRKDS